MNDELTPHMASKSLFLWCLRMTLIVLSLCTLVYGLWGSRNWERATPSQAGTLAATFGAMDSTLYRPILTMAGDSPLAKAGAKIGDAVKFDRKISVLVGIDEAVGLTLSSGGGASHLSLQPIPDQAIIEHGIVARIETASTLATGFASLLIALIIGLRRGDSFAILVFAFTLLIGTSIGAFNRFVPSSALTDAIYPFLRALDFSCGYVLLLLFILIYPKDKPLWEQQWARGLFYVILIGFAIHLLANIASLSQQFPELVGTPRAVRILHWWSLTLVVVSVLASLLALAVSWKESTGEGRQRLGWIGTCLGAIYVSWFIGNINNALGFPIPLLSMSAADSTVSVLALIGFGYALLRHRLFDLGFAVNRALVVTIISTFLLVLFGITEWCVDKLLHFEGREKNVIFDALVALGVILSFHRIQHWVSHQVDQIFFGHWYKAAENFRQFLAMAAHISDADVLRVKFMQAVTKFSGAAGGAIYAIDASGSYARTHSTLADAPAGIDTNHDVAVELRYSHRVVEVADRTILPSAYAFPMTVRGRVEGIVLLEPLGAGKQFRPDQLALLATGINKIGMDLESLRVLDLEHGIAMLKQKMELAVCEAATLRHVLGSQPSTAAATLPM